MGDEFGEPSLQRRGAEQFQATGGDQCQRALHRLDHGDHMQAGMRVRVGVVVVLGHAPVDAPASGQDASDM